MCAKTDMLLGWGAVPGGALARLRDEVQQLKGVVEVLTSATHLMAIPTPNPSGQGPDAPGRVMAHTSLRCCVVNMVVHSCCQGFVAY